MTIVSFEESLKKALVKAYDQATPDFLVQRTAIYIEKRAHSMRRLQMCAFGLGSALFSCSAIMIVRIEVGSIIESRVFDLLRLLYSDSALVVRYWQDFAMSILEAVPWISVILMVMSVWISILFLWLLAKTYKQPRYEVKNI